MLGLQAADMPATVVVFFLYHGLALCTGAFYLLIANLRKIKINFMPLNLGNDFIALKSELACSRSGCKQRHKKNYYHILSCEPNVMKLK